jgi:hypothetical protein
MRTLENTVLTGAPEMAGKAVPYRDAKTGLTFESEEFREKHPCDGITPAFGERISKTAFSVRDLASINHVR